MALERALHPPNRPPKGALPLAQVVCVPLLSGSSEAVLVMSLEEGLSMSRCISSPATCNGGTPTPALPLTPLQVPYPTPG